MTSRSLFKKFALASASMVALLGPVAGSSTPASAQEVKGYPSVKVVDLKTGKTVNLASNNNGKLPTLAWFWAPH